MMQKSNYSSIKTHKELLNTISRINQQIELQSARFDSSVNSVRYKYSFSHLMEIAVTKYDVFIRAVKGLIIYVKKLKSNYTQPSKNQTTDKPDEN